MKKQKENSAQTFETVLAALQETRSIFKEQSVVREREQKELERHFRELNDESERRRIKNWEDYEKRMKRIEQRVGAWANNNGSFAEEYFYNSFDNDRRNFFGEKFDTIRRGLKSKGLKIEDEYDIVLYNHTSVAIIEVKYKAHENDIEKTLKKAETFRILCPDYKDYKIYLGLASLCFYPELEQKCADQGIAIIKQVGDSVVVQDEHLKVF